MKIQVLSRRDFLRLLDANMIWDSNVENYDALFISILNRKEIDQSSFSDPIFLENHPNTISIAIDDVNGEFGPATVYNGEEIHLTDSHGITKEQAHELVEFIKANLNKKYAFIHCAAGISRSGAVGEFINDILNQKYLEFRKDNPRINPNPHIYKSLMEAYHGQSISH